MPNERQPPTSMTGWAGMLSESIGRIQAAPTIPLNGQDGDVLVLRDGVPTWVSPREAFRLDMSAAKDGHPIDRELFEQLTAIVPREPPARGEPIPRPPEPPPPPKKYRTAWEAILKDDE